MDKTASPFLSSATVDMSGMTNTSVSPPTAFRLQESKHRGRPQTRLRSEPPGRSYVSSIVCACYHANEYRDMTPTLALLSLLASARKIDLQDQPR